jgi:SAM-dependent methyltransferase
MRRVPAARYLPRPDPAAGSGVPDWPVTDDRDADATRLAAESLAQGDPTGWFERQYTAAAAGDAIVPWDRDEPNPLLTGWATQHEVDGAGRPALVVGCGLGRDAEYVAGLGFQTTAFDISPTAIRGAQERYPSSAVNYVVADLLDPPSEWAGAFGLVLESITVQAMPLSVRTTAIAHVGQLVAPGGELIVLTAIREDGEQVSGPPWPLSRAELGSFAAGDLRPGGVEYLPVPGEPPHYRARAVFRRD